MSRYHFQDIAFSDEQTVASQVRMDIPISYAFKRIEYPDISIPNRSLAWHVYFLEETSSEKKAIKDEVNEYNNYLTSLEKIPGFLEFFIENQLCVSRESISERWSHEIAAIVFSKKNYKFTTDLQIANGWLFDKSYSCIYNAEVNGDSLMIPIGEPADLYPVSCGGKKVIWNWIENGHDFCYSLWEILGERYCQNESAEDDDNVVHYYFDAYNQFRHEPPEPQLVKIYHKIEELGYIETITIKPERTDPKWSYFGKSDSSIDVALVDMRFLKNSLLMEQIEIMLWQQPEFIESNKFFLTDEKGKQYLSSKPGTLGGHCRLKIYGRLDCPSAARFIAKGQYIQHRVFFKEESVARAAGYRPCAKCMPEAYKQWKNRTQTEGNTND